jgi:hypothetical protein
VLSRRGRRRELVVAAAAGLVGLAAALWSVGEERRLGRVVAALVRARTGLSVTVGAASATGDGLVLRDVRLGAAPGLPPVDVEAQRVEVSGGWLPLVAPRAGPVSIRAVGVRFTAVAADGASSEVLEGVRAAVGPLLAWPGPLAFRLEGAEVRFGGRAWVADVSADRDGTRLSVVAAFAPRDGSGGIGAGAAGDRIVIEAVGRAAAATGVEVSRFAMEAGADVRLQGTATLRWGGDDAKLSAEAEGRIHLAGLGARLGLQVPEGLEARQVRVRWEGTSRQGRARLDASGVTVGARSDTALDVSLEAAVRGGWPLPPASLESARAVVRRGSRTLLEATMASRHAGALWPLELRGRAEDPTALAALGGVPATATGTLTVTADLDGTTPLTARGTVEVRLSEAAVETAGGAVRLTGLSATVPWAADGRPPPGTLALARVSAGGLTVTDVTGTVQQQAERLLVSGVRYRHAGGHGTGWIEWTPGARPALRARFDAEGVDLARVMRDGGWRLAHLTGTARYTAVARTTAAEGFSGLVRFAGEGGGEVSVEAVERLLESAAVRADDTWLLRQTLENLRVFRYEALHGEVRWVGGAGHVDLTLRGRRRLGLFPGPVDAINVRHVPLALLASTFGRPRMP